jgi:hypothetical protein
MPFAGSARVGGQKVAEVIAGGEEVGLPAQKHHTNAIIGARLVERITHSGVHRAGNRILLLSPRKLNRANALGAAGLNVWCRHGDSC